MIEATKEKLVRMKLHGMSNAYSALLEKNAHQSLTIDELLATLVESEWSERSTRKYTMRVNQAKLRYPASFEQIDFAGERKSEKTLLQRLSIGDWIRKKENIVITGPTGVGKSFIACAFGQRACSQEWRVMYYATTKLFAAIDMARADKSQVRLINKIRKQDVLILDDFGLEQIAGDNRLRLFEILEDRYGCGSTVIVSQVPPEKWHDIIKDKTIADAICDRLLHNAHRIKLQGDSYRKVKRVTV
jgi:DNA replication protein DnaC